LRAAQSGNGAALGQLLQLYGNYLALLTRLHIGRRLQGKVDAQDLVQDTFLNAHRDFAMFRGRSEKEFLAWLRQIHAARIVNTLRRYLGTRGRDVQRECNLAAELDHSSHIMERGLFAAQSSPSQHLAKREQAVVLANELNRLPADYREVLILRHLEGLRFTEVARRMGRSVDSVEKLWVRALARLRRSMGACHESAC
jgi:RNA polymerase sigma-70 factor (ECF subfamily)